MKRHKRSFWEKVVAEVEAGERVADVARRHRVRESTLRWWRSELRRRPASDSLRLVPVIAAEVVARQLVEVIVGATAIRIETGTDVRYVAELVRALEATAC